MRNLYLALILFFVAIPALAQTLYGNTTYESQALDGSACNNAVSFTGTQFRIQLKKPVSSGNIYSELACYGVTFQPNRGVILHIEPNSDLAGQASEGDVVLSIDNESVAQNLSQRHNYACAGRPAHFVICGQNGTIYTAECRRRPISCFSEVFQQGLLH